MPKRVTLVIHALNSGGAERVLAALANHWTMAGRQVTLITLDDPQTDRYPLHPAVHRIGLGLLRPSRSAWDVVRSNWQRVQGLRQAIERSRPAVVVSFTDRMNVLTLLASRRAAWPVLVAERNDPRRQKMSRGWELLRRWTYPRCAAAVVQTDAVASTIRRLVGNRPVWIIPNAVAPPEVTGQSDQPPTLGCPYLVAMGRLDKQKGFDLLIEAFTPVADQHPNVDLAIIGEGPLRVALEQQVSQHGLAERVRFLGWLDGPSTVLQGGELFVLSSRWEGFPNALLEAMACGLPAVSFACDSGPADIVRHEVDGLLVQPEDVPALTAAIDGLLRDPQRRRQMGERAREVVQRFSYDEFYARWDQALDRAAGTKSH